MKKYKVIQTSSNTYEIEITDYLRSLQFRIPNIKQYFLDELIDELTNLGFDYVEDESDYYAQHIVED